MITKNFKARVATLLQITSQGTKGLLSVKDVDGTTRYISCNIPSFSFPDTSVNYVSFGNAGIQVGTGNTAAPRCGRFSQY